MIESDAIEQALAGALRRDKAPKPGDEEMLRRLVEGVVQTPSPMPRRLLNARAIPVVGAGVAGAAVLIALAMHHPTPSVAAPPAVTPATTTSAPMIEAPAIATVVETAAVEPLPVETAKVASAPPQPTASQLFARANELRRQGHDGEAASTYTTLQQRYPKSPEAIASHMTLGRLLLDRKHAPANALEQFDRYLASRTHNELREEALIGRARSLQQLGRRDEEKRAWQTLLAEYPSSLYADQARERLTHDK